MTSLQLARKIAALLDEKQAMDITILDLRKIPQAAEFFVVATGSVDLHVRSLADYVENELRTARSPIRPLSREGQKNLSWVIVDYGHVILHVYRPESRKYYQLEKLWADAPRISLKPRKRTTDSDADDS